MSFFCPLCSLHSDPTLRAHLKHVRIIHSDDPNFRINCTLQMCQRPPFQNFTTYRNHVYAFHKDCSGQLNVSEDFPSEDEGDASAENSGEDSNDSYDSDNDIDADDGSFNVPEMPKTTKAAARWILKVREKHLLPQSTIETIIQDIDSLYEVAMDNMRMAVKEELCNSGVDQRVASRVDSLFDYNGPHGHLFTGLETRYKQMKYCKDNLDYVEPVSIVLGCQRRKFSGVGSKRRAVEKEDIMMYVPILETLRLLLNNEEIIAEIKNNHSSIDGGIRDYCDGLDFKEHELFSTKPEAIQIILYYDDLETCNALGSKRTKYKLGMFYYVIGNISPKLRSTLNTIQLLAIVKTKDIKHYSMNAVLAPIIADIAKLEEGYTFTLDGRSEKHYGTLVTTSADNLGQCSIGGFKEGATAYRGCRHCLAKRKHFKTVFSESRLKLRSLSGHERHCRKLADSSDNPDLSKKISKKYGVNEKSVLLSLKYFNMCNGSLIPDVMHDILEGVLQYEAKLLLCYCVYEKRYFSAQYLGDLMETFELGYMEAANRPTPVTKDILKKKDNSLNQNASQMWLFGRLLPLMVGHLIPEEDTHWHNFILLLEIVEQLLAPTITESECAYLQTLIEEHHNAFVHLYPESSVIPKMHYMVHMPRIIIRFGQLIRHWTMRFEARHQYFKTLASNLKCFKNITRTLSTRYQQLQCYVNSSSISPDRLDHGPASLRSSSSIPGYCQDEEPFQVKWYVIHYTNLFDPAFVIQPLIHYSVKWVKADGTVYKRPCYFVTKIDDGIPQFGELQEIIIIKEEVHFHLKICETVTFDRHFHAYVTKLLPNTVYITLRQSNLISYVPLHPRNVQGLTTIGQKAVIMKHHISCPS